MDSFDYLNMLCDMVCVFPDVEPVCRCHHRQLWLLWQLWSVTCDMVCVFRCWTCLSLSLWTTLTTWPETPPSWARITWMSIPDAGQSMIQEPRKTSFHELATHWQLLQNYLAHPPNFSVELIVAKVHFLHLTSTCFCPISKSQQHQKFNWKSCCLTDFDQVQILVLMSGGIWKTAACVAVTLQITNAT